MKLIKYSFVFIKHCLFYFISFFFVKSKKIWVFGCWEGELFADNSKYFFEWMNKNHQEIKCYWATRNNNILNTLKESGFLSLKIHSLKWFWIICRASICFETEGNNDIGGYKPARCKIIQLWHGCGPKKMNWNRNYSKFEKKLLRIISDDYENMFWFVPSKLNKKYLQDYYHFDDKHALLTGYCRTDALFQEPNPNIVSFFEKFHPNCKKVIYMPTHRFFGKNQAIRPSINELLELDKMLDGRNIVFVFKPHFHELKKYIGFKDSFHNVVLADSPMFSDVYSFIQCFDILVSDYSSIIYDFIALDRPIILFNYDYDEYISTEGLLDCYVDYQCGPIVKEWSDVLSLIVNFKDSEYWSSKRNACKEAINPYCDGNNCDRVFTVSLEVLNGKSKHKEQE